MNLRFLKLLYLGLQNVTHVYTRSEQRQKGSLVNYNLPDNSVIEHWLHL